MTTLTAARATAQRSRRLAGVDAARGLAVLGMVAVHVLPATTDDGGVSLPEQIAGGRSSAAFAVLAGVGVALATRRDADRWRQRLRLLLRALLIGALGLSLGGLDSASPSSWPTTRSSVLLLPFLGWPPGGCCRRPRRWRSAPRCSATSCGRTCRPRASRTRPGRPWRTPAGCCPTCCSPASTRPCRGRRTCSPGSPSDGSRSTARRRPCAGPPRRGALGGGSAASALLLGPLGGYAALGELVGTDDQVIAVAMGGPVVRQRPDRQLVAPGGRRRAQQHDARPRRHDRHGAARARASACC
jgi:hypothetical protein